MLSIFETYQTHADITELTAKVEWLMEQFRLAYGL
jgi:hypothetical protein